MYIVYSYEIIDGDIDFIERIKEEGRKELVHEAFKLAHDLEKEDKTKRETGGHVKLSLVYLVYDEHDKRVDGYPGLHRDKENWNKN